MDRKTRRMTSSKFKIPGYEDEKTTAFRLKTSPGKEIKLVTKLNETPSSVLSFSSDSSQDIESSESSNSNEFIE